MVIDIEVGDVRYRLKITDDNCLLTVTHSIWFYVFLCTTVIVVKGFLWHIFWGKTRNECNCLLGRETAAQMQTVTETVAKKGDKQNCNVRWIL